jgi:hypothetical protein
MRENPAGEGYTAAHGAWTGWSPKSCATVATIFGWLPSGT